MNNKTSRFIPVIIAVSIVVGILIGTFYTNHFSGNRLSIINTSSNKLNDLLRIIDDKYVDTVSMGDLVEKAMPQILAELDPHSMYIPAKDVEESNAELKGHFSGIGVSFSIHKDTICINNVIKGGPSEKVGLMPGDRIIAVDDSAFVGKVVNNNSAMRKLKGEKGSSVKLGIYRPGVKETLNFVVVRGDIPVKSVDSYYMITDNIGYVRINKFAETTYAETMIAIATLQQQGAKSLIIDLRNNTGGYMGPAVQIINEFLPKDRLIVYTEGRKSPREEYRSDGRGTNQNTPLVLLTNEISASASEIFSGAIQDNDRGLIIGRRTFGKGLVQSPIQLNDGSELLLTVARYYTPSGRCIQKQYELGKTDDYDQDIYNRYLHGEFDTADSIKLDDSLKYQTVGGRTVYGGGGIMPDIFIPRDTSGVTSYFSKVINSGILYRYALEYSDWHKHEFAQYENYEELWDFLKSQPLVNDFANYAAKKGIKKRPYLIAISRELIANQLQAYIIRNFFKDDGFYPVFLKDDPTLLKAIEVIEAGRAFPL